MIQILIYLRIFLHYLGQKNNASSNLDGGPDQPASYTNLSTLYEEKPVIHGDHYVPCHNPPVNKGKYCRGKYACGIKLLSSANVKTATNKYDTSGSVMAKVFNPYEI